MIEIDQLVMLARDELPESEAARVEEHVLACSVCAGILERLLQLRPLVCELVQTGRVAFPVTPALAETLTEAGLISRAYRLAPDRPVPCSVSTADIYALTTLELDLHAVERADVVVTFPFGRVRMQDVPFDPEQGALSYVTPSEQLRQLPSTRVTIEVLCVGSDGERVLGRYLLDHTALGG